MGVRIGELKKILEATVVQDFIAEGFLFNKSKFEFNKKIGKNKICCFFHFYNYSPLKVEYSFVFYITLHEIEEEIKKFSAFSKRDYDRSFSFSLGEGLFHPKIRNEIAKYRTAFTHIITDFGKDADTIEDSRIVLKKEFFTRLPVFSDFKKFQNFILNNYEFMDKGGTVFPAIVAAKLKDKQSFDKIIDYIWIKNDLNSKPYGHVFKRWVVDFIAYAES